MKRFLLAVDGSPESQHAIEYLQPFLEALPDSTVHLLTLLVDVPYTDEELGQILRKPTAESEVHGAEDHLALVAGVAQRHAALAGKITSAGIASRRILSEIHPVRTGIAEDILDHATTLECDTIVVAKGENSSLLSLLQSSVTSTLVKEARSLAVWVVC